MFRKASDIVFMTFVMLFFSAGVSGQVTVADSARQSSRAVRDSVAADSALEAVLRDALAEAPAQPQAMPPPTIRRSGGSLNPNISVVGAFFTTGTESGKTTKPVDTGLSEAEISLQAVVDPYSRADFFVAFGREVEDPFVGPDSAIAASSEYEVELEEAYVTFLSLPFDWQIKAGKFRSNFGKINQTHPHALNFLDLPRMYVNYFGEEGLGDRGVAFNWLVPNPLNFFQEFTLEVTSGAVEAPSFDGGSNHLLYLGHLKNFFDLTPASTLEVGLTGLYGPNDADGRTTTIGAVDLTYKWKPLRENRRKGLEAIAEALVSHRETAGGHVTSYAGFGYVRYQFARRWSIGGRFDYSEFPENNTLNEKAYAAILNFFATEFQKIELQFQHGIPAQSDPFKRVLLRAVFVIGAHGAHKY